MKTIKEQNIVRLTDGGIGVQYEDVKRGEIVQSSSSHVSGGREVQATYRVGNPIVAGGSLRRLKRLMKTNAISGWYVIFPEGSAWVAVRIDAAGDVVATVEQSNADTHRRAGDRYAWICEAIDADETDAQVTEDDAAAVVAAYDNDIDPMCCVVERIIDA